MRKHIIEATETYITLEQFADGKPFFGESPFHGRSYKVEHILDEFGDQVQRIFRLTPETMASEDITEEVACHWLYRADNQEFGLDDEDTFPAYVRNSIAWVWWRSDASSRFTGHKAEARLEYLHAAE
jgi:hypothetical protein